MSEHSKYSASSAKRWIACPGSIKMSEGREDKPTVHAAWGTVAHELASNILINGAPDDIASVNPAGPDVVSCDGFEIAVDQEMVDCVNAYIAIIRDATMLATRVSYETIVDYSWAVDVDEDTAWGTADAFAIFDDELLVADLKTGVGVVVDAVENEQLMLYALGVLGEIDASVRDRIKLVRLMIVQPRVNEAPSEWTVTVQALLAWARGKVSEAVSAVESGDAPLASGSHCRWCKASAVCPALRSDISTVALGQSPATPEEFAAAPTRAVGDSTEAHWLSAALSRVEDIESWCKSVRAEVERRLLAADDVPGFKLVMGKRGARSWVSDDEAEKYIREKIRLKIEDAYNLKLISPTQAEKLAKVGTIGPRQWPRLQALITQTDGKPSVAPSSDPRPALDVRPVAEDFSPNDDIC